MSGLGGLDIHYSFSMSTRVWAAATILTNPASCFLSSTTTLAKSSTPCYWTELNWPELNWTEERMVNRVRMLLCYDYINGRAAWGFLYNCFWTGARSLQTLEKPCKARAHIQLDLAMKHVADWNPSAPRRQPGAEPSRCGDLLEPKPIVCWCQKATITAPLVPNPIFCWSEWQQLLCYCRSL